jgi:hypothetical protein
VTRPEGNALIDFEIRGELAEVLFGKAPPSRA